MEMKQAEAEQLVVTLGGISVKSITKNCTHLVADRAAASQPTWGKIHDANQKKIPIVNEAWLAQCRDDSTKVDEDTYLWSYIFDEEKKAIANGTAPAAGTGTQRGAKRAANTSSPMPSKPKVKKPRAENGVKEERETVAEGQFIKKKDAVIPIDQFCDQVDHVVYINPDDGMIYDASLNQTNASNNNNKFYIVQLLHNPTSDSFKTWTRWGRVGESGQKALLGDGTFADALKNFEKKFKDKSGLAWKDRTENPKPGKYAFIERSYESDSDSDDEDEDVDMADANGDANGDIKAEDEEEAQAPQCTLEKPVEDLINLIFDTKLFQATMSSFNYNANKLPLGKLSKATILRGYAQLKDLAAVIHDPDLASTQYNTTLAAITEQLSNAYYSLIPHAFGRNHPPVIRDQATLKKEVDMLESLSDMKIAADLMKADKKSASDMHIADRRFKGLGLEEMTPLKPSTKEYKLLASYLNGTKGSTHNMNYDVIDIFRIERQGEKSRFKESKFSSVPSNRRLLWHGSRATNFGGILSQGLRIAPPEAPVSGYMFGKGIYLADISSKSAGYCCSYSTNGEGLLLLCEAELGDPIQELKQSSYHAGDTAKAGGMHSTKGMGSMAPMKWMDAGAVHKDLKGVQMVSTTRKVKMKQLLMKNSPIHLSHLRTLPRMVVRFTTTSTFATTLTRSSSDISSVLECRTINHVSHITHACNDSTELDRCWFAFPKFICFRGFIIAMVNFIIHRIINLLHFAASPRDVHGVKKIPWLLLDAREFCHPVSVWRPCATYIHNAHGMVQAIV